MTLLASRLTTTSLILSLMIACCVPAKVFSSGFPPVPSLPGLFSSTDASETGEIVRSHAGVKHIQDADIIRVGISDDAMTALEYPSATIAADSAYTISHRNQVVLTGKRYQQTDVTVSAEGFRLSTLPGQVFPADHSAPLVFQPLNNGRLRVPSITRRGVVPEYKGTIEVTRGYSSPAKLSVVNVLPLQEYLKAVVPNELPPRYGFEAVKAQSVAARNYAIRPREKSFPQFDICDSQLCQVYFGAQTEHPSSNQALKETNGLVALYDGQPILALYSSAHGGHSEDYANSFSDPASKQFPGTPVPYLVGKPDDGSVTQRYGDLRDEGNARRFWLANERGDYDGKSSYHRWEKQWPIAQFNQQLNQQWLKLAASKQTAAFISPLPIAGDKKPLGELKRLTVLKRGTSGKAMVVALETTKGNFIARKEYVLRKLFVHGGRMLPSANVVFSHLTAPNGRLVAVRANGGGFGHGVGMSQLGASMMSDRAMTFDTILQHYYSGVSIGTIPIAVNHANSLPQRVTFTAPSVSSASANAPTMVIQSVGNVLSGKPLPVMLNGQPLLLTPASQVTQQQLDGKITLAANEAPDSSGQASGRPPNWWDSVTAWLGDAGLLGSDAQPLPMIETRILLPKTMLNIGQDNQLVIKPRENGQPYRVWIEFVPAKK